MVNSRLKFLTTLTLSICLIIGCSDDEPNVDIEELPSDYTVYVSDAGNFDNPPWQILKFDHNGENPEVFINSRLDWPQDILFLEDKNEVLISNLNSGEVNRHNSETGAFISVFAESLGGPTRMKIGPDGYIYILQWRGSGRVLRYTTDGEFVDEFSQTSIDQAIGLDWDQNGNLYVSSFQSRDIRKFDSNGNDLGLFADDDLSGPTNIWFNENGQLLVNDWRDGVISIFDEQGQFVENFATGLSQVEGVGILPGGSLLIGNGGRGTVVQLSSDGEIVRDFVTFRSGNLVKPNAVVLRKNSN